MKKLLFLVAFVLLAISCEKEQTPEQILPKPTPVSQIELDAGYEQYVLPNITLTQLKAGNGNGNGNNSSVDNGIRIVWDSNLNNGTSPDGPIYLEEGESMQLSIEWLEDEIPGATVNWYTNDQQVASVNWLGVLSESWIGSWYPGYSTVTVITAVIYRPKPNYNGPHPWNGWLQPYQDNVVVHIVP